MLLRWATQQGLAVIPKSGSTPHMRSNLAAAAGLPPPGEDDDDDDDDDDEEGGKGKGKGGAPGSSFTLDEEDLAAIRALAPAPGTEAARLCWKTDPLKQLEFE